MFKFLFAVITITVFTQCFYLAEARAERKDFKVFDVRKNLPLTDADPIRYDYYVSIGQDHGVEKGAVLTVYRRVPVMDMYRNQNHDDMQIPVAKLKIIYSERTMSVGRVMKLANRDKIPVLEFDKVMTGDRVEFAGLDSKGDAQAFEQDKKRPNRSKLAKLPSLASKRDVASSPKMASAELPTISQPATAADLTKP